MSADSSPPMLDVAVIGAGLCGLRLAELLQAGSPRIAVYEARERVGGRVLTATDGGLDLGPTWYWPRTQPRITRLVAELGLRSFAQHDDGRILRLDDPNRAPQTVSVPELHGDAQRISGGMAQLTGALAARLQGDIIHLGHRLLAVRRHTDHVELLLRHGDARITLPARRLVLALPPRLVDETIRFEPELPAPLRAALRETPTWMATAAKAVMHYPRAFWRADGHSGNAFVQHPQAVLCEVFDACDEAAGCAALAGFAELGPTQRQLFRNGLPLLLRSQFAQLFGAAAEDGHLHYQDWAEDALACSALDRDVPPSTLPAYGHPQLALPHWDGRLYIGGSEAARNGGGYLEGALDAATRIAACLPGREAHRSPQSGSNNDIRLAGFRSWVQAERAQAFGQYRSDLHRRLSHQESDELMQRALLAVVEALYERALGEIARLGLETRELGVEHGRCSLTPMLLDPFMGFSDALLDEATAFNRSSCALASFPHEHQPDRDYLSTIRRDLLAAWRAFAIAANEIVLPATIPSTSVGA